MEDTTQTDLSFLSWCKKVTDKHPDILQNMRKSLDPIDRAISRRIMEIAEGAINAQ